MFRPAYQESLARICVCVRGVGMTLELEERNSVQDEGENPPPNSDTCESEPEQNRIFVRPR